MEKPKQSKTEAKANVFLALRNELFNTISHCYIPLFHTVTVTSHRKYVQKIKFEVSWQFFHGFEELYVWDGIKVHLSWGHNGFLGLILS